MRSSSTVLTSQPLPSHFHTNLLFLRLCHRTMLLQCGLQDPRCSYVWLHTAPADRVTSVLEATAVDCIMLHHTGHSFLLAEKFTILTLNGKTLGECHGPIMSAPSRVEQGLAAPWPGSGATCPGIDVNMAATVNSKQPPLHPSLPFTLLDCLAISL